MRVPISHAPFWKMLPQHTNRLVKEEAIASYVYKEVPLPSPEGDELLVKVGKVALCGTDISLYQWNKGGCGVYSVSELDRGYRSPQLLS